MLHMPASSRPSLLWYSLFYHIWSERALALEIWVISRHQAELDALVAKVQEANDAIQALDIIKRAEEIINRNLTDILGPVRPQSASFAMSEPEFREIADSIKVLIGRKKHFEVTENGLGYNNLLYISTVLGELRRSAENEVSLPILMIEEPEAHLHPQLQMLLVDHLVNKVDSPVQILLTSHSPTLASKVPVQRISVMHEGRMGEKAGKIVVKPIRECGLKSNQMQDLNRYLDITKSTLFFSRGVILVEGISEALLLPVLARKMGIDLAQHGVTVVNVSSLAFEPFARLFQDGGLDIPCALITDADPTVEDKNLSEDEIDRIIYPDRLDRISPWLQSFKVLRLASCGFSWRVKPLSTTWRLLPITTRLRWQRYTRTWDTRR